MAEGKSLGQGLHDLCRVGVALSCEKNIDKLLETIVNVARRYTNAEGCTLYLCNDEKGCLDFAVVQNERLEIYQTGRDEDSQWSTIPLFHADGSENHSNVSAHCALVGETICISNVYNEEGYDFSSTRDFDREAGYRSRSMLLIPMLDNHDDVIGVLQLLNARCEGSNEICDFDSQAAEVVKGLASQASIAVVNVRLVERIKKYSHLGVALSAEKDIQTLLQMIAEMARKYSHAEGCSVYLCNRETKALNFAVIQNTKLNISLASGDDKGAWHTIPLFHGDGTENHSNASAHCALTNKTINITDVYDEAGFDFSGSKEFDSHNHYRSQSMLLIPMTDHEDQVVGVLQLLNARKGVSRKVCPFPEEDIPMVRGLASQAAVAVTNTRLVQNLEELLKAFIKSIAAAIDEKSPYTGGHIQRVATLTEMLVERINSAEEGYFKDIHFSGDEVDEISIAAWMHDVGKIATPEYIVDKATKLETIYDRIEVIRLRIELIKREREVQQLRAQLQTEQAGGGETVTSENTDTYLDEIYQFLCRINTGGEFMTDEDLDTLSEIGDMVYTLQGKTFPLLNANEIDCCAIRSGTLTNDERILINHHVVVSSMMLQELPFPRKWQSVPEIAGMHHERLNGEGYPNGVSGDDISLPARILAVADIFEALTAADRPYKNGKTLSEVFRIMGFMVKDNHLDQHLCDLLVESGVAQKYAVETLDHRQLDSFIWNGVTRGPV